MFVGEDRRQIVIHLLSTFDEVRAEKRARLVVLRGQPGWGKTRIVQEFYALLASEQKHPAYWPERIAPAGADWDENTLRDSRKAVRPTAFIPGADVPEYLWVGTAADEGRGPRADGGLDEAIDQISVQLSSRFVANERAKALRQGVAGALGLAALGPAGAVLGPLLAAGDVADIVDSLKRAFRTLRGREIPIGPDARIDEKIAAFRNTVNLIWGSVLKEGPPGVLVIEDAHAIRRPSALLIEEVLTQPGLPFLIIACAHPARAGDAEFDEIVTRDLEHVQVIDLDALEEPDLIELVLDTFPNTNAATAAALADHSSGNPYVLRLLMLALRHSVHNGEITAAINDIRAMPSGIADLLLRLWHDLPEETQRTLSALAVVGNRSHDHVDERALSALRQNDANSQRWADIEVSGQSGWLRDVGDWREFLEVARWQVARGHGWLTEHEQRTLLRAGQEALTLLFQRHPRDPFLAEVDASVLGAAVELNAVNDPLAAARRLTERSESLYVDARYFDAEETARLAEKVARSALAEDSRRALAAAAEALIGASRARRSATSRYNDQALTWAEEALNLARQLPASDADLLARALLNCSRSCRRLDDEVMMRKSEHLILEARRVFDSCDAVTPKLECDLVRAEYVWPSIHGDREGAARAARHAFLLHAEIYGPSHPYSVECLSDEGFYLLRIDDPARALAPRETLLEQVREIWGRGHSRTASREKDLAVTIVRAGLADRAQEAHGLAEHAYDVHVNAFGRNANTTLLTATVLARVKLFLADTTAQQESVAASDPPALRGEALGLATHALDTKRSKRSGATLDCWPQRELVGLAKAALGDSLGPEIVREMVVERRTRLRRQGLRLDSRLEFIWAVESFCKALEYVGRADEIPEARRSLLAPIE